MGRKSRTRQERRTADPHPAPRSRWWVAPLVGGGLLMLLTVGNMLIAPHKPGDVRKALGVAALGGVAGGLAFSLIAFPLARAGRRYLAGIVVIGVYVAAAFAAIAWTGDAAAEVDDPVLWIVAAVMSIVYGIVFGRAFWPGTPPSEGG